MSSSKSAWVLVLAGGEGKRLRALTTEPCGTAVFTIGHSTRSVQEFIALLSAHHIELVVDVRTVPRSRRNPQFNRETLPESLQVADIGYEHVAALGGFRRPGPQSTNAGWRNASFRGYADYMQTDAFVAAIERLAERAHHTRLAVMCAEAVPWRCHRSLVADALVARGIPVEEVISATRTQGHAMTSFAHVEGTAVTYPG
jgi:uncharacterized protein (DUF488 family)